MNCPVCTSENLVISERQGIEIDYCPKCRGVWLDRGELDKIIERAAEQMTPPAPPQQQQQPYPPQQQYAPPPQQAYYGHPKDHYKKRKSWLNELFD